MDTSQALIQVVADLQNALAQANDHIAAIESRLKELDAAVSTLRGELHRVERQTAHVVRCR